MKNPFQEYIDPNLPHYFKTKERGLTDGKIKPNIEPKECDLCGSISESRICVREIFIVNDKI